jgi:N-methylhydantoinase A
MLLADPRLDTAQTFVVRLNADNLGKVMGVYAELETQGRTALRREFGEGTITIEREAEMRYKGQHHSIKVPLAETDDAEKLRTRFDQEYERRYGHANSAAEIELVVLHSLATLQMNRPDVARLARPVSGRVKAELETRPIFFLEEDRFLRTQVLDRYALEPGFKGEGPALIVEYGSSTIIGPRDTFNIGKLGEIDIVCHH